MSVRVIQCAAERAAKAWALAAIAGNNREGRRQISLTANLPEMVSFTLLKFIPLTLLCAAAASATVCTPLNQPAQVHLGTQTYPAFVNGIEGLSGGIAPEPYAVRVAWKSDTVNSYQRILYATAAEWAANPGVYPHTYVPLQHNTTTVNDIQGDTITGLQASTTYHIATESSTDNASWCAAVDTVATTAPAPTSLVYPDPPAPVTHAQSYPPLTGTARTVGTSTGCTGADNATAFQNCLNIAQPGDYIYLPAGITFPSSSSFYTPNNPLAVPVTLNPATGTFTCAACVGSPHNWTNGQKIVFGVSGDYLPGYTGSGLAMSTTYALINVNAGAGTFQVTYDGTNPIASYSDGGGGPLFVAAWPDVINAPYTVILSNGNLPPFGVRMDPVAYASQLATIQKTGTVGASPDGHAVLLFGTLASNWWIGPGVEFTTKPIALTTETDPFAYYFYAGLVTTSGQNYGIVFDRDYFTTASNPDRFYYEVISMQSPYGAFINNFTQPGTPTNTGNAYNLGRFLAPSSETTNTITVNGASGRLGVYSWPVNHQCTVNSPQTLTFTGGTGSFYVYLGPIPACTLTVQMTSGMTASGSGYNITTAASPTWPVDQYSRLTILPIVSGTVSGGSITSWSDFGTIGPEGSFPMEIGGPGPLLVDNNFQTFSNIGIFLDTPAFISCGPTCAPVTTPMDFTYTRNTTIFDPSFYTNGPLWNGGYGTTHTGTFETKDMNRMLVKGNIFSFVPTNLGGGGCAGAIALDAAWPHTAVNENDDSNIEISYNTCKYSSGLTAVGGNYGGISMTGKLIKNWWVHDNITTPQGYLSGYVPQPTIYQRPGSGLLFLDVGMAENLIYEHNTDWGRGGNTPEIYNASATTLYPATWRNNIFGFPASGIQNVTQNRCAGQTDGGLISCLGWTWTANVFLATWVNSDPSAYVEIQPGSSYPQIGYFEGTWPGYPSVLWPGDTLAPLSARADTIGFFNDALPAGPYKTETYNLRLKSASPYISGSHPPTTDGKDIGADIDALEAAQGLVSNVRPFNTTSTATTIGFLAPDTFGCTVDWGPTNFTSGTGTWTRVANAGGQRTQNVALSGLPAHSEIYYRVNCAVQQPSGSVQLP